MGRRIGDGISFYPMDVDYWKDERLVDLVFDCGQISELVYVHLLSIVYSSKKGYYIDQTSKEKTAKTILTTFFGDHGLTYNKVITMLDKMCETGLISKKYMEMGILTSKGIQKQYYASTIRRKEKERPYWLLNDRDEAEIDVSVIGKPKKELSGTNVDNSSVECAEMSTIDNENVCIKNQKEKEKKKENKTDKNDKYDKGKYPGYLNYCTACLIEDEFLTIYDSDIPKFNELFDAVYREYGRDFDLFHRCFTYCRDYVNRNKKVIDDKYNYFRVAFTNSMEHMEGYDERMQHFRETMDEILRGLR